MNKSPFFCYVFILSQEGQLRDKDKRGFILYGVLS